MLKNFRRVDVLRKYLNTKILQQRNCIRSYHVYKKVWVVTVGEALVCEREPKNFRSIRCGCEKRRNYHRTFTLKAVTGVFAAFAMEKYTVANVSVECEHMEWRGV